MHDATQPGFDPVREYDTRYREEELRYAKKMADSRETANHLTKEVLEDSPPLEMESLTFANDDDVELDLSSFDRCSHVVTRTR